MQVQLPNEFLSTGKLCQILQRSPQEISRAAEAAGIMPAMKLNDVPYFAADQLHDLRVVLIPTNEALL